MTMRSSFLSSGVRDGCAPRLAPRVVSPRVVSLSILGVMAMSLPACQTDTPITPQLDPAGVYQSLTLNYHGITLGHAAPYDTLTLVATPRSATGATLVSTEPVQYTSSDSVSVRVTSGGELIALVPNRTAVVYARLAINGVTRVDSTQVFVSTSATPPAITQFSVQPRASDSAKVAAAVSKTITPFFINGTDTLASFMTHFRLANYKVGVMNEFTGSLAAQSPGIGTVVATATVFGKQWTDSVSIMVGLPITGYVTFQTLKNVDGTVSYGFSPPTVYLGVGGVVYWTTNSLPTAPATPYDVVFDDTTHVKANPALPFGFFGNVNGDIAAWAFTTSFFDIQRSRMFDSAGTITYHSTVYNATGRIVVVNDRACIPNCVQ